MHYFFTFIIQEHCISVTKHQMLALDSRKIKLDSKYEKEIRTTIGYRAITY